MNKSEYISYTQGNSLNLSIGKQSKFCRIKELIKIYTTMWYSSTSLGIRLLADWEFHLANKKTK
jgi:hypothetical protein